MACEYVSYLSFCALHLDSLGRTFAAARWDPKALSYQTMFFESKIRKRKLLFMNT